MIFGPKHETTERNRVDNNENERIVAHFGGKSAKTQCETKI